MKSSSQRQLERASGGKRSRRLSRAVVFTSCFALIMAVAFAGVLSPLLVFIIAGLTGIVRPSDLGMRMALVGSHEQVADLIQYRRPIGAARRPVGAARRPPERSGSPTGPSWSTAPPSAGC